MVQNISKDTSSEDAENNTETNMINSYEPSSVQSGSKFSETCVTDRQRKFVKGRKVTRQNHAIVDDNDSDEIYSPKMKKRRSSMFIFILYNFRIK